MSANEAAKVEPEQAQQPNEEAAASNPKVSSANDAPPGNDNAFENLLGDVPLQVTVELGRIRMSLREIGQHLTPGSVIPLSKLTGESLDIRINDRLVARAEAVALGERYGVRMVEILTGEGR